MRSLTTALGLTLLVVVTLVTSGVIVGLAQRRGRDRAAMVDRLVITGLIAALGAVAILTLQPGPGGLAAARPSILDPFAPVDIPDALGNVGLYIPLGFSAAVLLRSTTRPVVWATTLTFAVSLAVELTQGVLPIDRAATTHDVVFNTAGGFVGATAGSLAVRLARKQP